MVRSATLYSLIQGTILMMRLIGTQLPYTTQKFVFYIFPVYRYDLYKNTKRVGGDEHTVQRERFLVECVSSVLDKMILSRWLASVSRHPQLIVTIEEPKNKASSRSTLHTRQVQVTNSQDPPALPQGIRVPSICSQSGETSQIVLWNL